MADHRSLSPALHLECDILMLDNLIYKTTASLLQAQKKSNNGRVSLSTDLLTELQMVESLLAMIKSTYLDTPALSSISCTTLFRLQLLRFTTLFTLRHERTPATPSEEALLHLRSDNATRAMEWLQSRGRTAFPEELRTISRAQHKENPLRESIRHDVTTHTLLDLIPSLIELTAARVRLGAPTSLPNTTNDDHTISTNPNPSSTPPPWTTTSKWLSLVSEMMLHAVLGPITLSSGPEVALYPTFEAFAWGPPPPDSVAATSTRKRKFEVHDTATVMDSQDATDHHNHLFNLGSEDPNEQGATWHAIRTRHLRSLLPPSYFDHSTTTDFAASSLDNHYLRELRSKHPLSAFENQMYSFLGALHQGLEAPVLVQLESEGPGLVVDGVEVGREEAVALRELVGDRSRSFGKR